MIAPGPSSRAPSFRTSVSAFDRPVMTLNVFPSTKMLSFFARLPITPCACAIAIVDTLAARPTAIASNLCPVVFM